MACAGRGSAASAAFAELCPPLQAAALRLLPVLLVAAGATMAALLGGAGRLLCHLLRQLLVTGPAALRTTPFQVQLIPLFLF